MDNSYQETEKYIDNFLLTDCNKVVGEEIKADKCFRRQCNCGENYVTSSTEQWNCESGLTERTFKVSIDKGLAFRYEPCRLILIG